jgi:hypothetical protein
VVGLNPSGTSSTTLIRPSALGPSTRIPGWRAQTSASSRCRSAPSDCSANPELMTTANRTPACPQASSTSTTRLAFTTTSTTSTGPGTAVMSG